MKVVIAIDSLKGSLSSIEAGMAIREGVLRAKPDAEVIVKPLADGGEGTTDALIEGMNGERIDLTVTGPMHTPVKAHYGYLKDSNTAVMEMASAAGITLVPDDAKDPHSCYQLRCGRNDKPCPPKGLTAILSLESAEAPPTTAASVC